MIVWDCSFIMKASSAKVLHRYRGQVKLIQSLTAVLQPLVPDHMWSQMQIACVRQQRLLILLQHSVMLLPLQGLRMRLLAAVQGVTADICDIEFQVSPVAAIPATPVDVHASRQRQLQPRHMGKLALRQLDALAQRCQNPGLQKRLRAMLARYVSAQVDD